MDKPEALRLADALNAYWAGANGHDRERQAAAELRRLHAENERLIAQRDALLAEHQQTVALQQRSYEREIRLEVEAEREACAEVADGFDACDPKHIATAIRARRST